PAFSMLRMRSHVPALPSTVCSPPRGRPITDIAEVSFQPKEVLVFPTSSSKNSTIVRSQTTVRLTRAALQTAFVVSEELGANLADPLFTSPRRHPRPDRERAILAGGRPFSVDVELRSPRWRGQRVRVAAWRWGHGPSVLLVHGWEGRGSQLGAFIEPLVA